MGGVRSARVHEGARPDAAIASAVVSLVETSARQVELMAPARFELPSLAPIHDDVFVGTPGSVRLEATYYDSADLALAAHGITLLRRHDGLWTLDLPTAEWRGDAHASRELR